jgi:hypothetical protein
LSYATVDEVCAPFPTFQRSAAGSISDAQIQKWIDDWAARIYSAVLARGADLATLVLTAAQSNFLRGLNVDGAVAELGAALQGSLTLQPGEYSLAAARRRSAERTLKQIADGEHDTLFGVQTEGAKFAGVAGAETTVDETPEDLGENRSFGKGQTF